MNNLNPEISRMPRFILIGCGKIGQKHAAIIAGYGHLVAVCDIVQEKAESLATQYKSKAYISITEMLDRQQDADIAVICTPNGLHASHAIACMQSGFHVLCEKPLCLTISECLNLKDVSQSTKKKLWVVKQNRFNPPVLWLKKQIEEGKLGKISSFHMNCIWNRPASYYKDDWHGTRQLDGGVLYTQFSHFIDLLLWLLGDVDSVEAVTRNHFHQNEIEDCGLVLFQMKSGAIGSLHYSVNACNTNMEGSFMLLAENGTIKIGGPYLNKIEYTTLNFVAEMPKSEAAQANDYGTYQGSMSNHHLVYQELQKVMNAEPYSLPDLAEGIQTVELIEKIYQVSEAGKLR
jgi:predicted dehydrogenase